MLIKVMHRVEVYRNYFIKNYDSGEKSMARSNWKGVISIGLVSVPVSLYPAENKSAHISFHQIDKRDQQRIKYQRINANTGKIVPWDEITHGYQYDKETVVPVPDDLLRKVAGDNAKSIDIEEFIDQKDLDLLTVEKNYYLKPEKNGVKGYVILRESLIESKKIGIGKVIISTREYLAALMPYHQHALILCLLKYDNEIRKPEEFDLPQKDISSYKVRKTEIEMAKQLIKSMSGKWKPQKYVDEYQTAIHQWIENIVKKKKPTPMKQRAQNTGNVIDFVELLKQSLHTKKQKKDTKTKSTKNILTKKKHKVSRSVSR